MTRKSLILILLFISWPINLIHRLWNDHPADVRNFYLFARDYQEDIQWYVHDICQCAYYLIIFTAMWLFFNSHKKRDTDIGTIFGAIIINHVIDVFHYIGWHRRNESILFLEGAVMLCAAMKIFLKNRKPN